MVTEAPYRLKAEANKYFFAEDNDLYSTISTEGLLRVEPVPKIKSQSPHMGSIYLHA